MDIYPEDWLEDFSRKLTVLREIADYGGPLRSASYIDSTDGLYEDTDGASIEWSIVLKFANSVLTISPVPADDSVDISLGEPFLKENMRSFDISDSPPWSEAIGKGLCWGWLMVSDQGYWDGIQFEFTIPDVSSIKIQLITMASELQQSVVQEIDRSENVP